MSAGRRLKFGRLLSPTAKLAAQPRAVHVSLTLPPNPGLPMLSIAWPRLAPWLMLLGSNLFMTFAWYGHLKHRSTALPLAILVSWLIALPEYSLAVPANRFGSYAYTTAELKVIQEVITLTVFVAFSYFYLGETIKLTTLLGFLLIAAGVAVVFLNR
jgi:uncharacterized protein